MAGSTAASDEAHESRVWRAIFWTMLHSAPRPMMERVRRGKPTSPIEEILIVGRTSGLERSSLLTVVDIDGALSIGHPNGRSQWVRNLEAAGRAVIVRRDGSRLNVAATLLTDGPERDAAIAGTGRQPFPAGLVYRLGRKHVTAVGAYFRLTPIAEPAQPGAATAS